MSYEFSETFDLVLPNIQEKLGEFSEAAYAKDHGLIVEVAAIHAGTTANFNNYTAEELRASVNSWLEPYPKPIIMNHDPLSEPVGRVMGAKMEKEADGTEYTRLQIHIADPDAMKKVADGRYLTGSVGGKANEALCTVCKTDWAKPQEGRRLPCAHQRGKVYNGKVAMIDMKDITFKEYSFVNIPADSKSSVRSVGATETDGWIKPARFFVLDMVQEGIVEVSESENRDVLGDLRKKDALPLYMGLKGAFISAQAIHESELEDLSIQDSANPDKVDTNSLNDIDSNEENVMAKETTEAQEEDVLAVAEGLSADLATATDEPEAVEEAAEESEENKSEEVEAEEAEATEESEEVTEEVEEGERPEGQEKARDKDVDPETGAGAPKSRESEEEEVVEEAAADTEEEVEPAAEEASEEAELNADENIEPRIAELEAELAAKTEENARLKKALHRNLVERVVDTKIALGLESVEGRANAIAEHESRTPGSLADSLRDLAKMEPASPRRATDGLEMTQDTEVVGNENNVLTTDDDGASEVEESVDPMKVAEDKFVSILTGRLKLNS